MRSLIIAGMVALVIVVLYWILVALYDSTLGIIPGVDWIMGGIVPWNLGLGALFLIGSLATYIISIYEYPPWGSLVLALGGILIITGVVPLGTGMITALII